MNKRRKAGFTLIELLVVIAIIGVLASIILVGLDKAQADARDAQRISDMKTIYGALELYYSDNGQYPTMHNENDIAGNWANMIAVLRQGQYLTQAEENEHQEELAEESPLQKLLAFISPVSVAYASAPLYQDPLYNPSDPNEHTYGYMPSEATSQPPLPAYQNFRLRAQMENPNDAKTTQSLTGKFLYSDDMTGTSACDPTLGYYCIGPAAGASGFDPGKPVIYLYPTVKTDVSVFIHPLHIDVSVPAYDNGWHVTASPDGELVNDSDGEQYPYLYWEGESTQPVVDRTKGFIVATKEIGTFLQSSLAAQGLKGTEISDFIAYWQPRMTTSEPYVYVYFMPQPVYDTLVPMDITPAPQTVIRVYMLFKPLAAPVSVTPETFTAPKRVGFTVVEWGGNRSPLQ